MVEVVYGLLQVVSTGVLGLLIGALLAEGAMFIPYWRTLPAAQFFSLHKEYGPRLYRFYAPLTIAATFLTVTAAGLCFVTTQPGQWATVAAAVLVLSMVGVYFLYFKEANAKFAAGGINSDELKAELARWAMWHWLRVGLGIIAFAVALWGLKAR